MANPIYDIAAISTNISGEPAQVYGTLTTTASSGAANTSSAQLEQWLNTVLTSAGWTCIATASANSRFNRDYFGLQSPWYDADAIPSWYPSTENVPWLRVLSTPSGNNLSFTVGVYDGTTGTFTNTTTLNYGGAVGTGHVAHAIASPFQIDITSTDRGFIFSALHIPDFVQERVQVRKAMFASSGIAFRTTFLIDNVNSWTIYQSNIGTAPVLNWFGDPNAGLLAVVQVGGGERPAGAAASGSYIWNPTDTNMGSAATWHPLIMPPTIAWQAGTAIPTATNTPTAIGMLWDSVFINRNYTHLGTMTGLPEVPVEERRDWLVVGSSSGEFPLSLLMIKGLSA